MEKRCCRITNANIQIGRIANPTEHVARIHVASTVNYELTMMYWHIGERINRDVLGNERADYGKQIVATVSRQLQIWYGSKGFEERTIRRMVQFAQEFPDWQIVSPLVSKLSWTHLFKMEERRMRYE